MPSLNVSASLLTIFLGSLIALAKSQTCDPVRFSELALTLEDGGSVDNLQSPTSVVIGHDQRLYFGTLGGTVQVVSFDRSTLQVTSRCYSNPLAFGFFRMNGEPSVRDILGITIDPRDRVIRPYVSTSTLFHTSRGLIDNRPNAAWRNGAVWRLRPGTSSSDPDVCLVVDRLIVSNLPVSNGDHGVNNLLFTQDGDLLIAVGGATNMGLPGFRQGNLWESPLSGAILVARTSRPGFNGRIRYTSGSQPFTARKIGGNVGVYAAGLRNPFAIAMNDVGRVYAVDQSTNCGFGNAAVSCDDFNLPDALEFNSSVNNDWPGQVSFDGCSTTGITLPDKLLLIEQGRFYGHPNIQRGNGECAWIDPRTNLAADGSSPQSNYRPQITSVQNPTTALGQYRGNHFCGTLRGELITSSVGARGVFRTRVDGARLVSGPIEINGNGGIALAENAHGELLFPRLNNAGVSLLRPDVTEKSGLYVAGISPSRHGRAGGNPIVLGGLNFDSSVSVSVGRRSCRIVRVIDTEIECIVPSHTAGPKDVVVTLGNGESETLENGILYMIV